MKEMKNNLKLPREPTECVLFQAIHRVFCCPSDKNTALSVVGLKDRDLILSAVRKPPRELDMVYVRIYSTASTEAT